MSETTESKFTSWRASQGLPKPIAELGEGFFWTRVSALDLPDEDVSQEEVNRRIEMAIEHLRVAESPTRFKQ